MCSITLFCDGSFSIELNQSEYSALRFSIHSRDEIPRYLKMRNSTPVWVDEESFLEIDKQSDFRLSGTAEGEFNTSLIGYFGKKSKQSGLISSILNLFSRRNNLHKITVYGLNQSGRWEQICEKEIDPGFFQQPLKKNSLLTAALIYKTSVKVTEVSKSLLDYGVAEHHSLDDDLPDVIDMDGPDPELGIYLTVDRGKAPLVDEFKTPSPRSGIRTVTSVD